MKSRTCMFMAGFLAAAAAAWVISCGGGSGGSDGKISLDIGSQGEDIPLGVSETSIPFTVNHDADRFKGPFGSLALDLQENLAWILFYPGVVPGSASGEVAPLVTPGGSLTLRIAPAEAVDFVCEEGELYGPFSITFDDDYQPITASPSSAEATSHTLDIINIGSYSICVQVTSPVDSEVTLDRVEFSAGPCEEDPEDMSGTWEGTYTCEGNCPEYDVPVELVVIQNPADLSRASYTDDLEGTYEGRVCGRRFSFRGGTETYSESGTFVMDPAGNAATKTSTYRDIPPGTCYGTCTDYLTRAD